MAKLTPEERHKINTIKFWASKATAGSWTALERGDFARIFNGSFMIAHLPYENFNRSADAALIANAKQSIEFLLGLIEKLSPAQAKKEGKE